MKKIIAIFFLIQILSNAVRAHSYGFYVDGYLLYNKDTTWCRLWFNPDTPYYNKEIVTWHKEEAKIISLENNGDLTGFGITQKGHQMNFGKIRIKSASSWIYAYPKKLAVGVVELYEVPLLFFEKDTDSYKLLTKIISDYYIGRTDNSSFVYPTLLKQLKKKKIAPFLTGYPNLNEITDDEMKPEDVLALVNQYNTWFDEQQNKSK